MDQPPDALAKLVGLISAQPSPEPQLPLPRPKLELPEIPTTPPPPLPLKRRAVLYSPHRRGYMRSTRECGIADEVKAMCEQACGTPFFDADEDNHRVVTEW
jgi:hypothetical protein